MTHYDLVILGAGPGGYVAAVRANWPFPRLRENMRRLGLSPFDIELVILSHGHFDHVTGLDGFIRSVGPSNLPLVVHPGAFTKRRIAIPGLLELELFPPPVALRSGRPAPRSRGTPSTVLAVRQLSADYR